MPREENLAFLYFDHQYEYDRGTSQAELTGLVLLRQERGEVPPQSLLVASRPLTEKRIQERQSCCNRNPSGSLHRIGSYA